MNFLNEKQFKVKGNSPLDTSPYCDPYWVHNVYMLLFYEDIPVQKKEEDFLNNTFLND